MEQVYLGIPGHSRSVDFGTTLAVISCGHPHVFLSHKVTSLLPRCFNLLLADAVNKQAAGAPLTHFCMIHTDVVPEDGWLAKMLAIMRDNKLDVLSALIPQKSSSGITSTALDTDQWNPRRLTMQECRRLPETFSGFDTLREFKSSSLLFNTGLLLCRLAALDPGRHFFEFRDRIVKQDGQWRVQAQPEDWLFARKIAKSGLKYAVTRAVRVEHYGSAGWSNAEVWGQATDGEAPDVR